MGNEAELKNLCTLLQIGYLSLIPIWGPSRKEVAYEKTAKICLLWSKLEMRKGISTLSDQPSICSSELWLEKAVHCHRNAMRELVETELDLLCKLLQIGDSSGPSKQVAAYKKTAEICILWAKLEMKEARRTLPDHKPFLDSCKQWIEKALHCHLMAISELRKDHVATSTWIDRSLYHIAGWTAENSAYLDDPFFVKAICNSLDDALPCKTIANECRNADRTSAFDALAKAYHTLALVMRRQGCSLMKGFGQKFEDNDYNACLPWFQESLEASERSLILYKSLNSYESSYVLAQFYVNTIKACIELVDVLTKTAVITGDSEENFNACIRSWFNYSQHQFHYLKISQDDWQIWEDPWENQLLDLKNVFEEEKDVHKLFFMSFDIMMARQGLSLSSFHIKGALSVILEKSIKHEEAKESDIEILTRLKGKVRALHQKAKHSAKSYIRFVYKEHPHPNPAWRLGTISTQEEIQEALRQAIRHYHPDSNIKHGREWVLICTEITKILNNKYNTHN